MKQITDSEINFAKALSIVYWHRYPWIQAFLELDDCISEGFLALCESSAIFDPLRSDNFNGYFSQRLMWHYAHLATIARAEKRTKFIEVELDDKIIKNDDFTEPLLNSHLLDCIICDERLKPKQREMIKMKKLGMAQVTIARTAGVSESAISQQYSLAVKDIRRLYA